MHLLILIIHLLILIKMTIVNINNSFINIYKWIVYINKWIININKWIININKWIININNSPFININKASSGLKKFSSKKSQLPLHGLTWNSIWYVPLYWWELQCNLKLFGLLLDINFLFDKTLSFFSIMNNIENFRCKNLSFHYMDWFENWYVALYRSHICYAVLVVVEHQLVFTWKWLFTTFNILE